MRKLSALLVLFTLLLSSCSLMRHEMEGKSLALDVCKHEADLDISHERVTGVYTVTRNGQADSKAIHVMKKNAVFDALAKSGSDMLLGPLYKIEVTGTTTLTYTVTVMGYPAKYINIRPVDQPKNVELVKLEKGAEYVVVTKSNNGQILDYCPLDKATEYVEAEQKEEETEEHSSPLSHKPSILKKFSHHE